MWMPAAADDSLPGAAVLRTHDVGEAQEVISEIYVPHRLRAANSLDARLNLVESSKLTFGYLTYGAQVELDVPPMLSCYHINLTLRGHTDVRHGAARAETRAGRSGVALSPQHSSLLLWSADAAQIAVKIPVRALTAQLSALLHDAVDVPPTFDLGFDLSAGGAGILRAAQFLARQLGGSVRHDDLIRQQTESYLLTQLLLAIPHNHTARLTVRSASVGRHAFEEAIDYIESYPERALGLAELAAVAGTTATALRAAFEHQLGMTEETYVRRVRLTRVHAEIRDTVRHPVNIVALARRWGFGSAHELRAAYQSHYRDDLDEAIDRFTGPRSDARPRSTPGPEPVSQG